MTCIAQYLTYIADTLCDGIGIDWTVELGDVQNQIGDRVAIQGNLDPAVLYASPEVIEKEVQKVIDVPLPLAYIAPRLFCASAFPCLAKGCHSLNVAV
jgi:uroporphyrinogen-III decarboxylase